VGDEVEVYVLDVDRERERVALSRKRLLPDPWYRVSEGLYRGDIVEGSVTNVVDFGAFVDIGEGVEGLVHVSEMPRGKDSLSELESGAPVNVRVLEIDEWEHHVALSLRDVDVPEGADSSEDADTTGE